MKNIILITKREFLTQIQKKSFILMTFLSPLLMLIFGGIIAFIFKANQTTLNIKVIDNSSLFYTSLKNNSSINYSFDVNQNISVLLDSLPENKNLDAILIFPEIKDKNLNNFEKSIKLYYNKNLAKSGINVLKSQIEDKIKQIRLENLGITKQDYKNAEPNISFQEINISQSKNSIDNKTISTIKEVLSFILMYVIFMFTIIYGNRVMRNILEEKNNRVVEIIISSVKPFELMLGKILGTTFVAFTQFSIWILISLILVVFFNSSVGMSQITTLIEQTNSISKDQILQIYSIAESLLSLNFPLIIFVFLFYFFFGYIFFSSIFAAIGSSVDSETETAQFTPIVIVPLSLAVYGSISIINNPEGSAAFWLSIFPVTSPIAMVARISFGVPVWELILSMIILILSTLGMILLAAKIYRVGILMYGKKINLKEIIKWIRY